jgi:hypothetical protein
MFRPFLRLVSMSVLSARGSSVFPLVLVAFALLATSLGCERSEQGAVLLVSGDTSGWITPCGCAANQSGGLARRATLVREQSRDAALVLVDAGGSAVGVGPYQRIKLESVLRGMASMGLDVHNVGGPETALGPNDLRELSERTGVKWLTTNLEPEDGTPVGTRVFEASRGGLDFLVTGVVDAAMVESPEWRASDPIQAVLNAMKGRKADVRIVLAYLDEAGLRNLAESLPEVDFIIGGPTGQTISPTKIGPVTMMSATNKGKFMAYARLNRNHSNVEILESGIAEVASQLQEDTNQLANLKDYYHRLEDRDFTAAEAGLVSEMSDQGRDYSVAGTQACVKCHQPDDVVWSHSKHAHAWEVLVAKGAQFDPSCQQCHTTGYGITGGFENVQLSKDRVHVGCENCHGPSQSHVLDPKIKTPFQAKELCIRCHDHENSPEFAFDAYWAKIIHAGTQQ